MQTMRGRGGPSVSTGSREHFAVALNQAEYDQLTKTSGQTKEFAESALPFGADELAYPWRVLQRK